MFLCESLFLPDFDIQDVVFIHFFAHNLQSEKTERKSVSNVPILLLYLILMYVKIVRILVLIFLTKFAIIKM